jgi:hypothetical protein
MNLVMIQPPGIDGAFVVSPITLWYARVLLFFSASATTDTGSKSFECALVSTLETYDDPENGNYMHDIDYRHYCLYSCYIDYVCNARWLNRLATQDMLDGNKDQAFCGQARELSEKLPVVPVRDTGTIPRHLRDVFPGAPGDRRPDAGDGCKMWFVNSWAFGWSRDL